MLDRGFTLEQIAGPLNSSKSTIARDLEEFSHNGKTQPRVSKRGRKGEGRPKGTRIKRESAIDAVREAIRPHIVAGEGISRVEWAERLDVGLNIVQRAAELERARLEVEPEITPDMLSMSAQQKFDAAIRQHKRNLDLEFEGRVQSEISQRLDHIILPVWRKKIADAKKIYDVRRSITNKETFNLIVKCLHTDTRRHIDDATVNEAFVRFMGLEKYLLNEKDSPTPFVGLPTTAAEWEKRKQEATALRRARRGHANVERV